MNGDESLDAEQQVRIGLSSFVNNAVYDALAAGKKAETPIAIAFANAATAACDSREGKPGS